MLVANGGTRLRGLHALPLAARRSCGILVLAADHIFDSTKKDAANSTERECALSRG